MGKRDGTADVKTFKHEKSGIEVKIKVSTKDGGFLAVYEDNTYRNKDLPALEVELYKAVEASLKLEWIKVIAVHTARSGALNIKATVGMGLKRFEVAEMTAGKWKMREWVHNPDAQSSVQFGKDNPLWGVSNFDEYTHGTQFTIPYVKRPGGYYDSTTTYYLAYNEELWKGLNMLLERIKSLNEQLEGMLGSQDMLERIALVGARSLTLLPTGVPEGVLTGVD